MFLIPLVMTRDLLIRSRLGLISCIGGSVAFPILLFCLLQRHGLEAGDSAMRRLVYMGMSFNAFFCAFSMSDGAKFRRGLYTLPITTAALVACQMIPAMLLAGLATIVSISLENFVFHQQYPIWTPAMFAGASFGACWATYWYTKDTAWQPLILACVAGPLVGWYIIRFFPFRDVPLERIGELSINESAVLVFIATASYFTAVAGVARDRCGGHLLVGNIYDRDIASFDFQRNPPPRFRSGIEAQYWYQWSVKGWVMPFCSCAGIIVFLRLWLIFSRKPIELVSGFVQFGGFVQSTVGGLISGFMGGYWINYNFITGGEPKELSHFVHSRPITNTNIARSQLYLVARSVVTSWAIWATCFLLVSVILIVTGTAPRPFFPPFVRWWYFPATFLGLWAAAASMHVAVMTGDEKRLPQVVGFFVGAMLLHLVLIEWLLSAESKAGLFRFVVSMLGIGLILGSAWLLVAARRKRLITTRAVVACLSVWFGLASVIIFEKLRHPTESTAIYFFIVGLASLVVAPFAAAPLAVSHNRNR